MPGERTLSRKLKHDQKQLCNSEKNQREGDTRLQGSHPNRQNESKHRVQQQGGSNARCLYDFHGNDARVEVGDDRRFHPSRSITSLAFFEALWRATSRRTTSTGRKKRHGTSLLGRGSSIKKLKSTQKMSADNSCCVMTRSFLQQFVPRRARRSCASPPARLPRDQAGAAGQDHSVSERERPRLEPNVSCNNIKPDMVKIRVPVRRSMV